MLGLRPRKKRQQTTLGLLRYSESISLGRSPTLEDIERLARKAGFRGLLNLNTEGEPGQLLSPNVEASWAHAFALQHERASITPGALRSEWVDTFLEALRSIARPVYVHSLHGHRAAALMTIHLALQRGLSGKEALSQAMTLGIECEPGTLRRAVEDEVDRRVARDSVPPRAAEPTPAAGNIL